MSNQYVFCARSEVLVLNGVIAPDGIKVLVPLQGSAGTKSKAENFKRNLAEGMKISGDVYPVEMVMG